MTDADTLARTIWADNLCYTERTDEAALTASPALTTQPLEAVAMADESLNLPAEIWKPIPNIAGYAVSFDGRVKRTAPGKRTYPGRLLKPYPHRFGYRTYKLTIEGRHRRFEGHKLVALAWIGPKPSPKHEVAHLDGNKLNDDYRNLAWKTHRENEADKFRHGTNPRGVRNGGAKLTEADIRRIRAEWPDTSLTTLARQYGVAFQTISKIVNRISWDHVI